VQACYNIIMLVKAYRRDVKETPSREMLVSRPRPVSRPKYSPSFQGFRLGLNNSVLKVRSHSASLIHRAAGSAWFMVILAGSRSIVVARR